MWDYSEEKLSYLLEPWLVPLGYEGEDSYR